MVKGANVRINKAEKMSPLEKQIQELNYKKNKIEYYTEIKERLAQKDESYSDYQKEVDSELIKFIDSKIKELETGEKIKSKVTQASDIFSPEDLEILEQIIARVKNKPQQPQANLEKTISPTKPKKETPAPPVAAIDPVRFVMQNKHLDGRKVQVKSNDDNPNITGKVVGLDAPWVIVKTDKGPTIKVQLENIIA